MSLTKTAKFRSASGEKESKANDDVLLNRPCVFLFVFCIEHSRVIVS